MKSQNEEIPDWHSVFKALKEWLDTGAKEINDELKK